MFKFKAAVWCYFILRRIVRYDSRAIILWILVISESLRRDGLLSIDDDERAHLAEWLLDTLYKSPVVLDFILATLVDDTFLNKNKNDVARLEKKAGKSVFSLWDTDPIFDLYPHLRGLGRNKYFEEHIWARIKEKQK